MAKQQKFDSFFLEADTDKDGYLSFNELHDILRKYGYKSSDDELKQLFKCIDTSGDNRISHDEYMAGMNGAASAKHGEAQMREEFCRIDKNGDGKIDKEELKTYLRGMGEYFTDAEIKEMIDYADKNKSGTIEYNEFLDTIAKLFGC